MFELFWHCVLMIFCFFPKELRLIFPNSQRLNRGNYVLSQLVQACRANEVTDLILVHEHRGEPGSLTICNLFTNLDSGWSRSLSTFCLIWKDIKVMPNQVTVLVRKNRKIFELTVILMAYIFLCTSQIYSFKMIVFGFLSVWSLYVITGTILLDIVQRPTHCSIGQNYVGQK